MIKEWGIAEMVNYRFKSHLLEVVDNQIKMDDPKCTKKTLHKLVDLGFEEQVSKEMIATVLTEEMFYVLKYQETFNEKRYCNKLALLPEYLDGIEERESDPVSVPVKNWALHWEE
jgi:hypothetical protein